MSAKTNRGGRPPKKKKSNLRAMDNRTPGAGFPVGPVGILPDQIFKEAISKEAWEEHSSKFTRSMDENKRFISMQYAMMDAKKEYGSLPFLLRRAFFDENIDSEEVESLGDFFVRILQMPADPAEQLLKTIISIKRNLEGAFEDRRFWTLVAYDDYFTDHGSEPTKRQLKNYIDENRETYKDMPAHGDGKGWTRIWKETGLFGMAER